MRMKIYWQNSVSCLNSVVRIIKMHYPISTTPCWVKNAYDEGLQWCLLQILDLPLPISPCIHVIIQLHLAKHALGPLSYTLSKDNALVRCFRSVTARYTAPSPCRGQLKYYAFTPRAFIATLSLSLRGYARPKCGYTHDRVSLLF